MMNVHVAGQGAQEGPWWLVEGGTLCFGAFCSKFMEKEGFQVSLKGGKWTSRQEVGGILNGQVGTAK